MFSEVHGRTSLNERQRRCPPLTNALTNRASRYKARAKINRRHGSKCTSLYICYLRVCSANTLLIRTTDIRVRSDTLRIFRSGKDAAGLNRSDVSASAETRHQKCTQMYTFDDAQQRSRCPPLVSAVEKTIRKPFENSGAGYKALNKQHPQARQRMYIRVHSLAASSQCELDSPWNHRPPWRY